jgi:hypothetical protein
MAIFVGPEDLDDGRPYENAGCCRFRDVAGNSAAGPRCSQAESFNRVSSAEIAWRTSSNNGADP